MDNKPATLLRTRPSILYFLPFFLFPLAVFFLPNVEGSFLFWVLEGAVLLFTLFRIYSREYRVADNKLESRFLSGVKASVDMDEIKEIEVVKPNRFLHWFNTGDVLVLTHRPDGQVVRVQGIEDPESFKDFIISLRRL